MKLQFPAGSDVAQVCITGNPKSPEPAHVRILFPGGHVEVVRATDGKDADYWVHVSVNKPASQSVIAEDTELAELIDARIDRHNTSTGASWVEHPFNKDDYHVAFRIKRTGVMTTDLLAPHHGQKSVSKTKKKK